MKALKLGAPSLKECFKICIGENDLLYLASLSLRHYCACLLYVSSREARY